MQWFHNRGTFARLLGSFGVVCTIMAVVGWMGISATQFVRASFEEVSDVRLPSIRALNYATAAISVDFRN